MQDMIQLLPTMKTPVQHWSNLEVSLSIVVSMLRKHLADTNELTEEIASNRLLQWHVSRLDRVRWTLIESCR